MQLNIRNFDKNCDEVVKRVVRGSLMSNRVDITSILRIRVKVQLADRFEKSSKFEFSKFRREEWKGYK